MKPLYTVPLDDKGERKILIMKSGNSLITQVIQGRDIERSIRRGAWWLDEKAALKALDELRAVMPDLTLEHFSNVLQAMRKADLDASFKPLPQQADTSPFFVNGVFIPKLLADEIKRDHPFATHRESWIIYTYKDGFYQPDGEAVIRELARQKLGELAKDKLVFETIKAIQDTTFTDPSRFEPSPTLDCLENGILNLETLELVPHTPEIIFTQKLSIKYDPQALCPTTVKRLYEWTGGNVKDMVRLIQFAGFCIYRRYFIRKAIVIHGEGSNAKTTFILFMTEWLGEKNVSSIKVQNLEKRFSAVRLFGKFANLCDDLPGDEWFATGAFKQATGGSPMEGEKKFKDEFLFKSYAKQLFTANKMPIVSDDTVAFWDRILIITFGRRFTEKVKKEDIVAGMTTEKEKSGFLNLAILGLASLLKDGEFFAQEDIETTKRKYIKISDPVMAFGHERCRENPETKTAKRIMYADYQAYCVKHGFPIKENNAFARSFKRVFPRLEDTEIVTEEEVRIHAWRGVELVEDEQKKLDSPPDNPQVPQDSHVFSLLKALRNNLPNDIHIYSYEKDIGENPPKPAEPVNGEIPPPAQPTPLSKPPVTPSRTPEVIDLTGKEAR